jgi:hypothetical protein
MNEYGINLAVIDKIRQPALLKKFKESTDWKANYEDRQAAIFVRNTPI